MALLFIILFCCGITPVTLIKNSYGGSQYNILLVIDVKLHNQHYVTTFATKLLNGISYSNKKVIIYTSHGQTQIVDNYKTKLKALQKIRRRNAKHLSFMHLLHRIKSSHSVKRPFYLLTLTDIKLTNNHRKVIRDISHDANCLGINMLGIGHLLDQKVSTANMASKNTKHVVINQHLHPPEWYLKQLHYYKEYIPRKSHVVIIMDLKIKTMAEQLTKKLLSGISLRRFRIALFTTYGVKENILSYQSRECVLEKLKSSSKISPLFNVMQSASHHFRHHFLSDPIIYLIVTDRTLKSHDQHYIRKMSKQTNCIEINIVTVNNNNHIRKRNSKIKIIRASTNLNFLNYLPFYKGDLQTCPSSSNQIVKDECNRECECKDGKLTNCYRVRNEFSLLSLHERERYLHVYKELSSNNDYKKVYDSYCYYHHRYFNSGIHNFDQFFPWHRKYILGFENLLRLIDCRITVPVWNWAYNSDNIWAITPSYHMWESNGGFGGNGATSNSMCVADGIFNAHEWKVPKYEDIKIIDSTSCTGIAKCGADHLKTKQCVRRRFKCNVPTAKKVSSALRIFNAQQFYNFDMEARVDWHNQVHTCVGGTMSTTYASDTPEFWTHHAMLDSVWDEWQKKGKEYITLPFSKDNHRKLLGFQPIERRRHYINNSNLAGCNVKVKYNGIIFNEKLNKKKNIKRKKTKLIKNHYNKGQRNRIHKKKHKKTKSHHNAKPVDYTNQHIFIASDEVEEAGNDDETLTSDEMSRDETLTSDTMPRDETLTSDTMPRDETLTSDEMSRDDTLTSDEMSRDDNNVNSVLFTDAMMMGDSDDMISSFTPTQDEIRQIHQLHDKYPDLKN